MDSQNQVNVNGLNTMPADGLASVGSLGTPPPFDTPTTVNQVAADLTSSTSDLQDIKNQALAQLQPMLKSLNQTPDEHFKTLMMMIQASDNQELIKEAYAAAQQITDNNAKAQALLDIINEINYFTHKQD